ncbi:MAG: ISAs1 family transposase [Gammaproteobacteria bacterium]|nr:ISAs1 family transposase [Gammaproteobacteria bacterium]
MSDDPTNSNSLLEYVSIIPDPRVTGRCNHLLVDIIVIAITAILCGADDWNSIEGFGKAKQEWFRRFLQLPSGIPSHDTFRRVFTRISPSAFQECFIEWVRDVAGTIEGVIAIDGKTLRRSHDRGIGKKAIHMVSAWAAENSLVLGQVKTDEKSNEITAIPELLKLLDINGCIVTIDAMGCQKAIAKQIIEQSSAVEGRNGQLSLYHHGCHRLGDSKLAALTAVHNFHIRRADGTTAAERFFGRAHTPLFEQLIDRMPLPPRPRSRRPRPPRQPYLMPVAA